MSASAQHLAIKLKLNNLQTASHIGQQIPRAAIPRAAGIVRYPARSLAGPRYNNLATEIAKQFAAGRPVPAAVKEPILRPPSPARSALKSLIDVPTLIVSLVATGLLMGSALATMMLTGTIEAPWSEHSSPPSEKSTAVGVMSASAAGKAMPSTVQLSPPAGQPEHTAALPQPEAIEDIDDPTSDQGLGLFGDVRTVYHGDGQPGVAFGAIYDAPGHEAAQTSPGGTEETPDLPMQALTEEDPARAEPAKPQAGEALEAKWIELPISINLRRGPSSKERVIGVVEQGTKLQELERKRGWVKVIDPQTSETGWLYPNSALKARRAAKQPTPKEDQSKSAPTGPFATLGNWLGKP